MAGGVCSGEEMAPVVALNSSGEDETAKSCCCSSGDPAIIIGSGVDPED